MKKVLVIFALVAAVSAYSQGTVNFNTKVATAGVDAPISYAAGGPMTAGAKPNSDPLAAVVRGALSWGGVNAMAALYGGPVGATESQLVLLVPAVGFRSGAAAGYVTTTGSSRTIDSVAAGAPALVQIRAWDTGTAGIASYEAAIAMPEYYHGKSQIIHLAALGGGSPPLPAANLVDSTTGLGIAGFSMTYVPEPSIIGLGILGAVAGLMVFRRRE